MNKIDVPALKDRVDLCELAGRYTTLKPWGRSGELAGPCPQARCTADEDGFHVHPDGWWKCYSCHPKRADAIEWVLWLRLAPDFRAACEWLANMSGSQSLLAPPSQPVIQKKHVPGAPGWADPGWQAVAQRALAAAIAALNSPAGEPCRAYLAGRGVQSEAWRAWRLGYDSARFDPIQERRRPAIVLPWIGPQGLTGLKYRFLESQSHHDRFSQMRGSQQVIFGGHLLTPQHDTLILCEGELNAVSIWQALRAQDTAAVDVVSFGSQGAATSGAVLAVARHYQRVILWADETAPVRACMDALGDRTFGLKSPSTGPGEEPPVKLDANVFLQRGLLGDLLRRALSRFQVVIQDYGPESAVQATSAQESATLPQPEHDTSSPAVTSAPRVESKVIAPPAPRVGETVRIPLDHLTEYLAEHRLRIVGGDPAQNRQSWRPLLYLADQSSAGMCEHRAASGVSPNNV